MPSRTFHCEPLERRLVLSTPPTPNPFLFLSGYADGAKSDFQQILPYYSAVGGITTDGPFVQSLRADGKLFLYQTIANPAKTVAQLVADWSAPLNNTLGGTLPGGFDAIQIDEFGAYPDGSAVAINYAAALQQLRSAYPDKRIFVWSTWNLADGGPNSLYGDTNTYSTLLNAINNYADRYMLECYINEANNQLSLFNPLSDNIESFAPGLRAKTVFGIYIPQSGFVADDSTNVGYWGYLDAQLHTIRNDAQMASMPGAAFWVAYRSEKLTWDYVGRLVNHYFTQNQTSYFGDGSFAQMISNAQFETSTTGWTLTPGTGGLIARTSYAADAVTPTYHDDYGFASHQSYALKMVRGTTGDSVYTTINVSPGITYTVSVFVKAGGASSGANRAKLSITNIAGTQIAAKEAQDAPLSVVGGPWKRILYNVTVPAGTTQVRLMLSNPSVPVGTTLYWDFVEMEPAYLAGNGIAPAVTDAWFEISPAQAIGLRFNEDVAPTFTAADVQLVNLSTGATISSASMVVAYPGGTSDARITFDGLANDVLPDGHYRMTLKSGAIQDTSGSVLQSNFNYEFFIGTGGSSADTYTVQRTLAGDALTITKNAMTPWTVPIAGLGIVAFSTAGGNDTLKLDLTNGLPWASAGILYNLGAQISTDTLQVIGSAGDDSVILDASQFTLTTPAGSTNLPYTAAEAFIFDGQAGNDTMTLATPTPNSLLFRGGTDLDTLNVNAASYHFSEDALLTTQNLTLNLNGGAVTSDASQRLEALNISDGQMTMSPNGGHILRTRSLSITSTGRLDLADNDLVLDYSSVSPIGTWTGSAYDGLTGLIAQGRNGGSWDGSGFTSSLADPGGYTTLAIAEATQALGINSADTALFGNETVDGTSVLVKYTYGGDANLSGSVDVDDYGRIDLNAALAGILNGFFNGDFDYSSSQDVDDYGIIDFVVNIQGGPL